MEYNQKPLTLEQLRQMDRQPAWGVSLISGKPGEWFIVRIVEMSKMWTIACSGSSQAFGGKDTYGKTWLAYGWQPTDIDKLEPCQWCSQAGCLTCTHHTLSLRDIPCSGCSRFGEGSYYEPLPFCPYCGRPQTADARVLFEKRIKEEARKG